VVLNDKTKRMILIVVWAAIVLSIILSLVEARFEEQKAALSTHSIKYLRLAGTMVLFIAMPLMVSLAVLLFYADHLRSKIDAIELAARMRIVVSVAWWVIIALLVLLGVEFLITLYNGSHRIVFAAIQFLLLSLCLGFLLLDSWTMLSYFRTHTLHNVVVVCLLDQQEKYVKTSNFDKAYSALLKACETDPNGVWLWCRLALFCQITRKNSAEADKYMAKAEELITTTKASNIGDKACYIEYLGLITYLRGERDKGLEYLKQSIDIESKPHRTKRYEELLSYSKNTQPDTNPPDFKTVT
jgi:tetratricopeptide (TPR) repeat protein